MKAMGLRILTTTLIIFGMTSLALAQDDWNIEADKQLDVSLMSLKDKEKQIIERNIWLEKEMKELEYTIQRMAVELKALEESKAFLSGSAEDYEEHIKNLSIVEKQAMRADMTIDQLESERRRIDAAIHAKEQILTNIRYKIDEYKQGLDGLKNQPVDRQVKHNSLDPEINKYRLLIEKSIKNLSKLEANYQDMTRRHWKPQAKIDKLREKQEDLKQQVQILEDELAIFDQEESMLKSQIEDMNGVDQGQLAQLQKEVELLEERNQKLEKVLVQAQIKLQQKNVQFDLANESTELLAENLNVIKKENQTLQDKILSLQSTFEKLVK